MKIQIWEIRPRKGYSRPHLRIYPEELGRYRTLPASLLRILSYNTRIDISNDLVALVMLRSGRVDEYDLTEPMD